MAYVNVIRFAGGVRPARQAVKLVRPIERASWIPAIGVEYYFGIDGISLLLIILTTGLGFLSVLSSWTAIEERVSGQELQSRVAGGVGGRTSVVKVTVQRESRLIPRLLLTKLRA